MFSQNRNRRRATTMRSLCVFSVIAIGARAADPSNEPAVFKADDPASLVTIDGPWAQPLVVRIVTLSDVPAWTALIDADATPDQPQRIATMVRHPDTGEIIHINLVERVQRVVTVSAKRGRSRTFVESIVNTQRPFTRDAQWQAARDGIDIRQPNDGSYAIGAEATGWWTGLPVVEIPVQFDPHRAAFIDYGIRIVPPMSGANRLGTSDDPNHPVEDEGGDPGGNPDPPGGAHQPNGEGDPENGDGTEGGDGGDGGDPGGNPDPPTQEVND